MTLQEMAKLIEAMIREHGLTTVLYAVRRACNIQAAQRFSVRDLSFGSGWKFWFGASTRLSRILQDAPTHWDPAIPEKQRKSPAAKKDWRS